MHDKYFIPALYVYSIIGLGIIAYDFYSSSKSDEEDGLTLTGATIADDS